MPVIKEDFGDVADEDSSVGRTLLADEPGHRFIARGQSVRQRALCLANHVNLGIGAVADAAELKNVLGIYFPSLPSGFF